MNNISTRLAIGNHADHKHPHWSVRWTQNGNGYDGSAWATNHDGTSQDKYWRVWVGVSTPASTVTIIIEDCGVGAFAFHSIPGHTITAETLWWASVVALEALQHHPYWIDPRKPESDEQALEPKQ